MENDIKTYRKKELPGYFVINMVIILLGIEQFIDTFQLKVNTSEWSIFNAIFGTALFSVIIYVVVLVLDSLIPGKYKMKLIWFYKGMPGGRIFSEIRDVSKDDRFTPQQVKKQYADIYTYLDTITDVDEKQKIENNSWYNIFKQHEFEPQIFVSHKDSLLFRDMHVMTIWLLLCFIGLRLWYCKEILCVTTLVLLIELITTWFIARFKGNRFAYNVIAADLNKESRKVSAL